LQSTEDASSDAQGSSSTPDAGGASSDADGASPHDGGSSGDAGRPIDWAVAWVQGFYGTSYDSIDVYSNTNEAGAPDGYYTTWRGDPGVTLFANVSDCSSFSDTLMLRSYGWLPATTLPRPHAEDYYWAIRGGAGFAEITNVTDIQVGDVLALLYPPGASDTGFTTASRGRRPRPTIATWD
jgi:hypothetical protein